MATMKDIANAVGVSLTTVSNVIHGNFDRVSPQTVARIQEAIEQMHYVPNMSARALVSHSPHIIAYIDTHSPLETYAGELTKSVRFFQTNYLNGKVGGIVLSGYAGMIPLFSEYIEARTNIPTMRGNPWQSVRTTPEQQRALASVASEFAVVIGLSERSND